MADDTTQDAPPLRASTLALTAVGVMAVGMGALAFTLSFDSLRQLAVEIGVRPGFSWMAPVAIDIAQAAATFGYVELKAERHRWSRRYCLAFAVGAVGLSVAGNGYHAYQLAVRNAARVAAGEDLGFIPQPAPAALGMAMIFPLLWLGLMHMSTLMLRAFREERAHALQGPTGEPSPVIERAGSIAPATYEAAPEAAPVAQQVEATADLGATRTGNVNIVEPPRQQDEPVVPRTRNGWPQTHEGLTQFLTECALPEPVKEVAEMLVREPHLKQVTVAQQINVDRSTVCRRWKAFVAAAEDEGFSVPPLPQPFDTETDFRPARELQPA
ncbi:DUF2637 domain-containing protein [Rhodococcus sp. JVH1]|uniref:DUF2637 domain-containing protein n=1 Tax=Rhodococcus sp. JVH1 TaxID=745408 RepID=UPI000271EA38|nr:DUF2637 domain-containing protein [Rhodococcus sp. JVH1]EJI98638.1 putative membrane protein [Rhodococcus sp. JVH1]